MPPVHVTPAVPPMPLVVHEIGFPPQTVATNFSPADLPPAIPGFSDVSQQFPGPATNSAIGSLPEYSPAAAVVSATVAGSAIISAAAHDVLASSDKAAVVSPAGVPSISLTAFEPATMLSDSEVDEVFDIVDAPPAV